VSLSEPIAIQLGHRPQCNDQADPNKDVRFQHLLTLISIIAQLLSQRRKPCVCSMILEILSASSGD
jgi:hypothetical protein